AASCNAPVCQRIGIRRPSRLAGCQRLPLIGMARCSGHVARWEFCRRHGLSTAEKCRPPSATAVAAPVRHPYISWFPTAGKDWGMARVTVEDCVLKVPNRFELVLLAAQRAREITSGAPLTLDRDDDKNPVVALREIADDTVGLDHLQDSLVRGMQKHVEIDDPEEAPELEQTLFGVADPTDAILGEDEIDEAELEE